MTPKIEAICLSWSCVGWLNKAGLEDDQIKMGR